MKNLAQAINIGDKFNSPWGDTSGLHSIGNLVSIIIGIAFALAGLILLFYMIVGGIGMIAGAGENNPQKVGQGKQALTSALIGFVVVFVAYWIIRIIELITQSNFITNPGI
jgi:Zn-dependent protease with chaperone function